MNKVQGITSVNVTLKRGVAHMELAAGNAVSLPQLRRIIKDAGYVAREAIVTVRGTVTQQNGDYLLAVTGTSTSVRLTADPAARSAFAELSRIVGGGKPVEIVGTIEAPDDAAKKVDTLRLRSVTVDP